MPSSQGIHLDVTLARDASVSSAALHRRIPPLGLRGDWKEAALAETHTHLLLDGWMDIQLCSYINQQTPF